MATIDLPDRWGVIDENVVASTLRVLDRRLRARYGENYVKLILFGSRARGDNQVDSDADVAIVFRNPIRDSWAATREIIEVTYDLLIETGLYIEAWPVEETSLDDPDASPNPQLAREIIRDGVAP